MDGTPRLLGLLLANVTGMVCRSRPNHCLGRARKPPRSARTDGQAQGKGSDALVRGGQWGTKVGGGQSLMLHHGNRHGLRFSCPCEIEGEKVGERPKAPSRWGIRWGAKKPPILLRSKKRQLGGMTWPSKSASRRSTQAFFWWTQFHPPRASRIRLSTSGPRWTGN